MSTQHFEPTETEADLVSSTGQAMMTVTGWQACLHEVAQCLRPCFQAGFDHRISGFFPAPPQNACRSRHPRRLQALGQQRRQGKPPRQGRHHAAREGTLARTRQPDQARDDALCEGAAHQPRECP